MQQTASVACRPAPAADGLTFGLATVHYRWVALFLVWGGFLLSYIDRRAWSSIAASAGESIGIEVAMLGIFVTAFYAGYVIANIAGGIFTDMFGARVMTAAALIPLGLLTFSFSYTRSLWFGFVIQAAMGLAAGADYSAGMKIISAWFRRSRGVAMGLYTTATSLAVVLANATVPPFSQHYGWEAAFRILGVITVIWGIVSIVLLRNGPAQAAAAPRASRHEVTGLLKNRNLVLLAVAGCFGLWGTVGFVSWGNALMTKTYHVSPVMAGQVMTAFGVGAFIAKPVLGWLSDLRGVSPKALSILCMVCFALALVAFGQCSTVTQFFIVAPLIGVFGYGFLPVLMAMISDASGQKVAGSGAGLTNALWQSGSALSPLIVGQMYGLTHSFEVALITLAVGPVIACGALYGLSASAFKKEGISAKVWRRRTARNNRYRPACWEASCTSVSGVSLESRRPVVWRSSRIRVSALAA